MDASVWAGVREQILQLARAPEAEKVFGAAVHRFALLDPLTPDELAEAEAQFGVRLPRDYREFLLRVGAGGAGPCYGIFPLVKDPDGRWRWDDGEEGLTPLDRLAEPFPTVHPHAGELAALEARRPGEAESEDAEKSDTAFDEWVERRDALLFAEERDVGAVALCHQGCAHWYRLVVSGPAAGQIWDDGRAGDSGLAPLTRADARPLTFADWYLDWLDGAARTAARSQTRPEQR